MVQKWQIITAIGPSLAHNIGIKVRGSLDVLMRHEVNHGQRGKLFIHCSFVVVSFMASASHWYLRFIEISAYYFSMHN